MTEQRSSVEYRVPYADTDQMGVVYYANYLVYFERARTQVLHDLGLPYKELETQGIMLPVLEAHAIYKKPAFYDDLLTLEAEAELYSATRVKLNCYVKRDGKLLAKGYTIHAVMDAVKRKPAAVPEKLSKLIQDKNT